jgi:hypothetical protein
MSDIAQVPILGPILEAFRLYGEYTLRIVRHPVKAVPELARNDAVTLADAGKFLLAAITIIYLFNIPAFRKWEAETSQPIFLFFYLLRYAIIFPCVHLVMKLLGSPVSFVTSMRFLAISIGVLLPPTLLFQLPFIYYVGPDVLFLSPLDVNFSELMRRSAEALSIPLVFWGQVALYAYTAVLVPLQLVWFKRVYGLNWTRTLVGTFGGITVALVVVWLVINPLWEWLRPLLELLAKYS